MSIADEMTMGGAGGYKKTLNITYQYICRKVGCKYHLETKRKGDLNFCPKCGNKYGE